MTQSSDPQTSLATFIGLLGEIHSFVLKNTLLDHVITITQH